MRKQLRGITDDRFRPDVEGLRAVAVVAVVLFHLRLGAFSGGFVGVDVFFVLSGFLITGLLLKELESTGELSLPAFWARRARRLLPASFLVLVVTLLAGRVMMSPLAQPSLAVDATASGAFVVNVVFANRFGDYFAAQLAAAQPSPLLHFWSLAVEEQFYLLWPLLLVAMTRRPRQYRRLLVAAIVTAGLASLLASVWMTRARPTWAFYLLPARMVELLAGAAVAAAGHSLRSVPAGFRAALGWLGIAGIAVAVVTYDTSTEFPGYAAMLPVLSTVLVIAAGGKGASPNGPVCILRHPGALWVGRHSYAIYLWHWPVLVLTEARYGPLPLVARIALVGISVGLAMVSLRYVEDPVRHSTWLARRASRGLALGGVLCLTAVLTGSWLRSVDVRLDGGEIAAAPTLAAGAVNGEQAATADVAPAAAAQDEGEAASPALASPQPLAAGSLDALIAANRGVLEQGLTQTEVPSNLRPALRVVNADRAKPYADGCVAVGRESSLNACHYGAEQSDVTVVLYGDSHAAQWFPALEAIADDRGYELIVMLKGGCPTADVPIPTATLGRTCPLWRDAAVDMIAQERPEVLIVSGWSGYPNDDVVWQAGLQATMERVMPSAGSVVLLGDAPPAGEEPADCLSRNLTHVERCVGGRGEVVPAARLEVERLVASGVGARFVDPTEWLCTEAACPVLIGDILLYRDATHITTVAAEWFRPLLEASLAPVLG